MDKLLIRKDLIERDRTEGAPCQRACPAGIDVARCHRLISTGKFDEALAVYREKVPFPAVLGHVCPAFCERQCRMSELGKPIAIKDLKRFATEKASTVSESPNSKSTGKRVAVVGSGPAGLTAAYYLTKTGHSVTVFEALPEPGGMMRVGIPERRLPREIVDNEIKQIEMAGVKIITGTKVNSVESLFEQGYDAIFLAVGTDRNIKGVNEEDNCEIIDSVNLSGEGNSARKILSGDRVTAKGNAIEVNSDTLATNRRGIFAGGDVVRGPSMVINAIADGRQAAISIDKYLGGTGIIDVVLAPPEVEIEPLIPLSLSIDRVAIPSIRTAERAPGNAETSINQHDEAVINEAKRCLWCDLELVTDARKCSLCRTCQLVCSLAYTQTFNLLKSRIIIGTGMGTEGEEPKFTDDCIHCNLCARYCAYDGISLRKRGN